MSRFSLELFARKGWSLKVLNLLSVWHRKPSELEQKLLKLNFKERDIIERLRSLCETAAKNNDALSYVMERHPFRGESLRVWEQMVRRESGGARYVACEVLVRLYPHSPQTAAALKDALLAEADLKVWEKISYLGRRLEFTKDRFLIDLLASLLKREPDSFLALPLGSEMATVLVHPRMTHRDFYLKKIKPFYRGPEGNKFDGFDAEVLTEFDHKYAATQALGISRWFPSKWIKKYREKVSEAPKVPASRLPWLFREKGPSALFDVLERQPKVFLESSHDRLFPDWKLSREQFQKAWKLMDGEVRTVIGHQLVEASHQALTEHDFLGILEEAPASRAAVSVLREMDRRSLRPKGRERLATLLSQRAFYHKDLVAKVFLHSRGLDSFKHPKWSTFLPFSGQGEVRLIMSGEWLIVTAGHFLARLSRTGGEVKALFQEDLPLVDAMLETGLYVGTNEKELVCVKEGRDGMETSRFQGENLLSEPVESVRTLGDGKFCLEQKELNYFGDLSTTYFILDTGSFQVSSTPFSPDAGTVKKMDSFDYRRKKAKVQSFDENHDFPDSSEAGGRLLLPKLDTRDVALASLNKCWVAVCKERERLRVCYWS